MLLSELNYKLFSNYKALTIKQKKIMAFFFSNQNYKDLTTVNLTTENNIL